MHKTIRQKYMVLFHLIFLLSTTILPNIRVHTDLFLLFAHDHSTKVYSPLSFTFFWAQAFDKNIWSSFIYSFFCARPFDQKLRSTLIYFFIFTRPFNQKLGSSLIYSICIRPFDWELGSSLIYFFYLHTAIRPNYKVLFHLLFL